MSESYNSFTTTSTTSNYTNHCQYCAKSNSNTNNSSLPRLSTATSINAATSFYKIQVHDVAGELLSTYLGPYELDDKCRAGYLRAPGLRPEAFL